MQAALKTTDFASLRGAFKLGNNGFPIQDFYLVKVAKRPDGKFQTRDRQGLRAHADRYAKDCVAKKETRTA